MVHMELSSDFIRMIQKSSYYWEGAAQCVPVRDVILRYLLGPALAL